MVCRRFMDIPATDYLLPYRYLQFYNLLIKRHLCKSIERVIVLPTTTKAIFLMYYSRIFRFLFCSYLTHYMLWRCVIKPSFRKTFMTYSHSKSKHNSGYNINNKIFYTKRIIVAIYAILYFHKISNDHKSIQENLNIYYFYCNGLSLLLK